MPRTLTIALFAATLAAGCQKPDKSDSKPAEPAHADPGKPAPVLPPPPVVPALPDPVTPPEPVPAAAGSNTELQNKSIALMQQMADVFAANQKNCDKLAVDLKAFIVTNKPALSDISVMLRKLSDQEKLAFEVRNRAVQQTIGTTMQAGALACASNPNVQAAMREFPNPER